MRTQQHKSALKVAWMIAVAGMAGVLQAGVIATNADVTSPMDATGGSESDPNLYVFDAFDKAFTTVVVGNSNPWNELHILGGSEVTTSGGVNYVGNALGADHCRILISGAGSSLAYVGEARVGDKGVFSRIDVENGGELVFQAQSTIGYRGVAGQGNDCGVVVDNATFSIHQKLNIGYNANNVRNYILVRNGGTVEIADVAGARIVIGRFGATNDVTVAGRDSRLLMGATASNLSIPENTGSGGHACTLTLVDESLARIDKTDSSAISVGTTGIGDNRVRFASGFLAWKGDHVAHLNVLTQVALWNGTEYVTPGSTEAAATLGWTARYYLVEEESEALADTGYAGLGGYTVFTGGEPMTPPIPLATVILLR